MSTKLIYSPLSAFRPMLACTIKDLDALKFPLYVQPKIDGVRCIILNGKALTRALKPIANKYTRQMLEKAFNDLTFDGELVAYNPDELYPSPINAASRRNTSSAINSIQGLPRLTYYIFDSPENPHRSFKTRLDQAREQLAGRLENYYFTDALFNVRILTPSLVETKQSLLDHYARYLNAGYEGLIARAPKSLYKFGRSTMREGYLLRLKQIETETGTIVDIIQKRTNNNPQTYNELGYATRSSAQENQTLINAVGAFVVQADGWNEEFKVGTGLTELQAKLFWKARRTLIGQKLKFSYMPVGSFERPNSPVFKGLIIQEDVKGSVLDYIKE